MNRAQEEQDTAAGHDGAGEGKSGRARQDIPEAGTAEGETAMDFEYVKPMDIEKRSMEIIAAELAARGIAVDPEEDPVVRRVIHTSADFDYAENLVFSEHAVSRMREAIAHGASIVTDTEMARAGISKRNLESCGGKAVCFMSDTLVAAEARQRGVTRASVSMERAAEMNEEMRKEGLPGLLFAIGNAPTALIRIHELMEAGKLHPAGIIGVPVGFVNVVEAKELILRGGAGQDAPHIVARGRKGGSNVAAAVCNALIYGITRAPQ